MALSVTVRVELRAPVVIGVKVTLIVHWAPTARLPPQLFIWAKSREFEPEMAMLEMPSGELLLLESVTA